MNVFSYRQVNLAAFCLCIVYLSAAFLLENFLNLPPCPLCILQRWIVFLLLVLFFIAGLWGKTSFQVKLYATLTSLFSLFGIALSVRHLWVVAHPAESFGVCAPNLSYLFKQLPLLEAIKTLFLGSGDCATMAGSFLGMSIPFWTLLGFLSLLFISIWQIIRKNPSKPRW